MEINVYSLLLFICKLLVLLYNFTDKLNFLLARYEKVTFDTFYSGGY
jgi:hypothetical protein